MNRRHITRAAAVIGIGAVSMAAAAPAFAGTIDNASHYYAADGNTTDSGNGPSLVFNGTPAYTAGGSGNASDQAFSLNGASSLTAPNSTVFNYGTRDQQAYFRFKTSTVSHMDILSKRATCSAATSSFVDIQTTVTGGTQYMEAKFGDSATNAVDILVPFTFADGAYHTIFFTRNKNNVTFNIDGASGSGTTTTPANIDNTGVLTLGAGPCSASGGDGTAPFTGAIDAVFLGVTVPPASSLPEVADPALLAVAGLAIGGAGVAIGRRRRSNEG